MAKKKHGLLIVAHPDDETIFFAGLLLRRRRYPWHVVCVTDGNADGRGAQRRDEFLRACRKLKVSHSEMWTYPDIYEKRLNVEHLRAQLGTLPAPAEVFTHGILGEYGHPHHQDVSFAVHETFHGRCPVYSVAYNCAPELVVHLKPGEYMTKTKVLSEIYGEETRRFAHLLPATFAEGFVRLGLSEVRALYAFFAGGAPLERRKLKVYRWFWKNLHERWQNILNRPF